MQSICHRWFVEEKRLECCCWVFRKTLDLKSFYTKKKKKKVCLINVHTCWSLQMLCMAEMMKSHDQILEIGTDRSFEDKVQL